MAYSYKKVYGDMEVLPLRPDTPSVCRSCWCGDLCRFLVNKTGVATTCTDFQNRVQAVVDREIERYKAEHLSSTVTISNDITENLTEYLQTHEPPQLLELIYQILVKQEDATECHF